MILSVEHLRVAFRLGGGVRSVPVRDVSFAVAENARVALVGESGCGKSLTALALGGLVDRAEISGTVTGRPRLAYIFQNPMQSLNPTMRCGAQIKEGIRVKGLGTRGGQGVPRPFRAEEKSGASAPSPYSLEPSPSNLLAAVGLPPETARKYPCELSGGQQQRVMIAMALAQEPDLLIADEPTTALDVTTQKEVLDLIRRLADERGMAVLFITHNLGLVAEYSDEVNVMYAGEIVERGRVADVLARPRHPYTKGLLAAVPSLDAPKDAPLVGIPGTVPQPTAWPVGCAFHPRCPVARPACATPAFTHCPELPEPPARARRGQAMVEYVIALVALLVVAAAMAHVLRAERAAVVRTAHLVGGDSP